MRANGSAVSLVSATATPHQLTCTQTTASYSPIDQLPHAATAKQASAISGSRIAGTLLPSSVPLPVFSLSLLFTFPPRVLCLSCLSCLFLLLVHSRLSLLAFIASFLFFTFTSAPATGHPNTIEHLLSHCAARIASCPRPALLTWPAAPAASAAAGSSIIPCRRSVSLRFSLLSYSFHLHHWLYLLLLYLLSLLLVAFSLWPADGDGEADSSSSSTWCKLSASQWRHVIAGWCMGGICQGIKYDDWSSVVWRQQLPHADINDDNDDEDEDEEQQQQPDGYL